MSRPARIRWQNVARLAAALIGCAFVLIGLPSLIRRPEPPPLEPDIGLAPASSTPTRVASRAGHDAEPAHNRRRRLTAARTARRLRARTLPEPRRRRAQPAVPRGERIPEAVAPAPAPPAPPPASPAYAAPPPPAPPPAPDVPAPQPGSAPPPAGRPEFGFEY